MTDPAADDVQLVERLCRGEAAAAHELYRRHGAALLRFGLALGNARQTAEDVVHDTFVEFLHNPRRFDPVRGSVAAYLYGIARHQLARVARHAGAPRAAALLDTDEEATPSALDEVERERTIDRVRRAILSLPIAHREVVALCDLEELPYATVASILDCPIGTVRSRLHRARALLAARLGSTSDADATRREPQGRPDDGAQDAAAAGLQAPLTWTETST